jgi:hypothetical protein
MRFPTSLVLLALFLAASSAVSAHPNECTNQTIKGSYAFTIHGQILSPNGALAVDGIAKTIFDGNGGLNQVDAVAVNGQIPGVWRPGWGTYSLNADCTGTMTINTGDQPALHLAIVVSLAGDLIHTVVTDPGFAVTSDAERVAAPKPGEDWFRGR